MGGTAAPAPRRHGGACALASWALALGTAAAPGSARAEARVAANVAAPAEPSDAPPRGPQPVAPTSAEPLDACPREPAPAAGAEALAVAMASLGPEARLAHLLWLELSPDEDVTALGRWLSRHGAGGLLLPSRSLAQAPWRESLRAVLAAAVVRSPTPLLVTDLRHAAARAPAQPPLAVPTWSLAAAGRPALAYLAGRDVAAQLGPWRVDLVVGPSLALEPVPHHPSPRSRPFGEDPNVVATLGGWLLRGLADGGLGALSPVGIAPAAQLPAEAERMAAPLLASAEAGLGGVLLGTDAVRTGTAAWLRARAEALGPQVATFAGSEGGASLAQAAVAALVAGADAVLVPSTAREGIWRALRHAAQQGELDAARVAQAAQKTLALRWRHPSRVYAADAEAADGEAQAPAAAAAHRALLRRAALAGTTLLRHRGGALPLHPSAEAGGAPQRLLVVAPAGALATRLGDLPGASVVDLPRVPSRAQRREVAEQAARLAHHADVVVMAVHNAYQREVVVRTLLARPALPVVVVSLGAPSLLADLPRADALVCAYDGHEAAQEAAADVLLGLAPAAGTLPAGLWLPGAPPPG